MRKLTLEEKREGQRVIREYRRTHHLRRGPDASGVDHTEVCAIIRFAQPWVNPQPAWSHFLMCGYDLMRWRRAERGDPLG